MGPHNSKELNICMTCKVVGVDRKAEAMCFECAEPLCSDCVRDHRKNKASRNHNIQEGGSVQEDIEVFKSIKSMVSCQEHPDDEVSIECIDHMKFICRKCHFSGHMTCNVKELGKVGNVKDLDSTIKNATDILKEVHTATVSAITQEEENIKMLREKQTALKQERYIMLRNFNKLNTELERKIERFAAEEESEIEKDIAEHKYTKNEVKMNEIFIQKVVKSGNAVWIEVVNDFVMKKAKELEEKTNDLNSKKKVRRIFNFKPSEAFMTLKQMSSLGNIEIINEGGKVRPSAINNDDENLEFSSDTIEGPKVSKTSWK